MFLLWCACSDTCGRRATSTVSRETDFRKSESYLGNPLRTVAIEELTLPDNLLKKSVRFGWLCSTSVTLIATNLLCLHRIVKEQMGPFKPNWGLPWWSNGWESAANAGDAGSVPSLGRSHRPQSNQAHAHDRWSLCLEPVLCNGRSLSEEKPHTATREQPLLSATGESPRAATKTQEKQKSIN